MRPKVDELTWSEWKAIKQLWWTEGWDLKIVSFWRLYEQCIEWQERYDEWR